MKLKYAFAGASLRGLDMFIAPMIENFGDYCEIVGIYDLNVGRAKSIAEKLELLPITCYKQSNKALSGLSVVNFDVGIAERLASLSEPYDVSMKVIDRVIHCNW